MRLLILSLVLFFSCTAAHADAYYDQGVKLYAKRDFKQAATYFEASMQKAGTVPNTVYYAALSYQQLGDFDKARALYKALADAVPGTEAGNRAVEALKLLQTTATPAATASADTTRQYTKGAQQSNSNASKWGTLSAPERTRVYYQTAGGNLYIDAQLNGRPLKMVFDTGASLTVLTISQLEALNIAPPTGPPTGYSRGVGGSGGTPMWTMRVDLKVGDIVRHNFPCGVIDAPTLCLLGQTFIHDFQYSIDRADNSIVFTKTDSSYAMRNSNNPNDRNAVPFTVEGNEMLVTATVNGKSYPMYFDTGASSTVFGMSDVKNLNLNVPQDAKMTMGSGIGGATAMLNFPVDRISLGPIEKYNFNINVALQESMGRPLLGQTFYHDWKYTIDNEHQLIHFLRR